jgi:hypothetical protein
MRYGLRVLPVLAAVLGLSACDENWDIGGNSERYKEDFHFNHPLAAGGRITLDNFNGSVEISGWDKDTVEISGTKYANTESRLREIRVDVTPSPGLIAIRTSRPSDRRGNSGARYVIHVPRKAELDGITSSNGAIRVEFLEGRVRLRTSNGAIRATNISGPLDAQTSNGSVEATAITGDAQLRSSNGPIRADVRRGSLEARTSNGGINVRVEEADSKPVRLESSNGRIELEMNVMREVHAETSNSSITVRMPGTMGAQVRAHTSNSSITSDFDVSVSGGRLSKHHLEGKIGEGGPMLDLSTSNGAIKLLRH